MHDDIYRHMGVGQPDGAQDLLGILDIDIADEGDTQKTQSLLAVNKRNEARFSILLNLVEKLDSAHIQQTPLQDRDDKRDYKKQPN